MPDQQREFLLAQKIVHKPTGEEFDLGYLSECTLIEGMDLSGPKVILRLRDPYLYLQDTLKVSPDDEITITFADAFASDGLDTVMDFTVLSAPVASDMIVINAMCSPVLALKRPTRRSRLYSTGAVERMLSEMFPGVRQEIAKCPISEAYHVLAGERPSLALRQMAREQGGHVFFDRDRVVVARLSELMESEPVLTYYHNDNRQELQVISYQAKSPKFMLQDRIKRRFAAWSITGGWMTSSKNTEAVPDLYGSPSALVLDGINAAPIPVLDCTITGNGQIRAGSVLAVVWGARRVDAPLNEALPEKFVVWSVAHHYSGGKYFSRVKGVVPMEED
jgi:hypothetical protein